MTKSQLKELKERADKVLGDKWAEAQVVLSLIESVEGMQTALTEIINWRPEPNEDGKFPIAKSEIAGEALERFGVKE